jgi:hypothetical protein
LDSSVGGDDDWPLEFLLEVLNDLVGNLSVSWGTSEWDSDMEALAHGSVSLLVFNQVNVGNSNLVHVYFQIVFAHLQLLEGFSNIFFDFRWLAAVGLNDFALGLVHLLLRNSL